MAKSSYTITPSSAVQLYKETPPTDTADGLPLSCDVTVVPSGLIAQVLSEQVLLMMSKLAMLAGCVQLRLLHIAIIPDVLLAGAARSLQHDWCSIKLGARWLVVTNGSVVEVIAVAANVITKRVGASKLVRCQDTHSFGCLVWCWLGRGSDCR
jgi:hypothetical protein